MKITQLPSGAELHEFENGDWECWVNGTLMTKYLSGEKIMTLKIRKQFEYLQGTDVDYLLICKKHNSIVWNYNIIPMENCWENMEEAIQWHFDNNWDIVEIYDLYASFERSMVRSAKKRTTVS